jgi:hypothetical protein
VRRSVTAFLTISRHEMAVLTGAPGVWFHSRCIRRAAPPFRRNCFAGALPHSVPWPLHYYPLLPLQPPCKPSPNHLSILFPFQLARPTPLLSSLASFQSFTPVLHHNPTLRSTPPAPTPSPAGCPAPLPFWFWVAPPTSSWTRTAYTKPPTSAGQNRQSSALACRMTSCWQVSGRCRQKECYNG